MALPKASSAKLLAKELQNLQEQPMEGFRIALVDERNLYDWQVAIFGPPGTLYEGGYFKAIIRFPGDYPFSPPTFKFVSRMWHPNVFSNGEVCISILHPPVADVTSGELPQERWNPTQNVRTILMSVISMLNEPNTSSPANVDASVMFRKHQVSKGEDKDYSNIISKQVAASRAQADADGVVIPSTVEEYCIKHQPIGSTSSDNIMCDDDWYNDDDDDDDDFY